jgi:hypothetical protein
LFYQISFEKVPLSLILQIVLFHSIYHHGYLIKGKINLKPFKIESTLI